MTDALSKKRQHLYILLKKMHKLIYKNTQEGPLIKGTPALVFRRCSKINCRCKGSNDARHGPYKVIQVYRDGKQKQISLKKSDEEIWEKVGRYQSFKKDLVLLKTYFSELQDQMEKIMDNRIERIML